VSQYSKRLLTCRRHRSYRTPKSACWGDDEARLGKRLPWRDHAEIAREAGVSELTLFRNFGSKEKLFEGLLGQYTFLPRLRELRPVSTASRMRRP